MTVLATEAPAAEVLALPRPALPGRASLRAALEERRSTRAFRPDPLPPDLLSGLLWAAFGVNRAASGGRTAPSAHGWREIQVHAVTREGAWRYDAEAHRLVLVDPRDLRPVTGTQDDVGSAPLELVYVADLARMAGPAGLADEERLFLAAADTGCIVQNVGLFCAAAGLGSVVRGLVDRRALAAALDLPPTQRITLAQSVGWPAP